MVRRLFILLFSLLLPIVSFAGLKRGEVGIRFVPQGAYYYASVIRQGWEQPRLVRLGSVAEIDSLSRSPSLYRDDRMYHLLFDSLREVIHTGESLFFVPGGQIRFVNLAALACPRGLRCFQKYKLFRVSTLEQLPREKRKKRLEMQVEVFGGMDYYADPEEMWRNSWFCHSDRFQPYYMDIPGRVPSGKSFARLGNSRDEVKSIFSLSRWVFIPRTGANAQEELFRQGTRRSFPYMMHLSTHSFQSLPLETEFESLSSDLQKDLTGMSCGLLFSGAGHTIEGRKMPYRLNDGLLYAQEIVTLDMRWCDLLVLSCCNSAEGPATRQTVYSLGNAFKEAGVHTLLLTVGGINDKAASVFMEHFYTYLVDGYTKHESLDRARTEMMRDADFSDPVYWAPFIMLD